MSHLHFPDGFLPLWLWLGGLVIAGVILAIILYRLSKRQATKDIALVGALEALMIVGMSFEIIPLGYHINLAIPVGIFLGPALGFLTAFVTNLFLALVGHGGITVVGLNTLLLGFETAMGWFFFKKIFVMKNIFARTFISSMLALVLSTTAAVTIIWFTATSHLAQQISQDAGILRLEIGSEAASEESGQGQPNLALIYTLSGIGWIIESTIGATLISYIAKVKPGSIRI